MLVKLVINLLLLMGSNVSGDKMFIRKSLWGFLSSKVNRNEGFGPIST